jgi:class 3 adenylate cyclase
LDTELTALAVWDGRPGDGAGGTATMVDAWRARGWKHEIISVGGGSTSRRRSRRTRDTTQKITALLFGDVVRYSTLTEQQIPIFVRDFMGTVGKLLDETRDRPIYRNTWGDGLYLVFDRVAAAGRFALELRDRIEANDWSRRGLPRDMTFRLALHAGPTFAVRDPVTRKTNYTGAHVSRAARIEPITAPGQVYASRQFAALAAAEEIPDFLCEYVGQIPLAKKFGTYPVYHVRRGTRT